MAEPGQLFRTRDVKDQGVVPGPPFGCENFVHSLRIQAVGPQTVHRLGGNGHQPPRRRMSAAKAGVCGSSAGRSMVFMRNLLSEEMGRYEETEGPDRKTALGFRSGGSRFTAAVI